MVRLTAPSPTRHHVNKCWFPVSEPQTTILLLPVRARIGGDEEAVGWWRRQKEKAILAARRISVLEGRLTGQTRDAMCLLPLKSKCRRQ